MIYCLISGCYNYKELYNDKNINKKSESKSESKSKSKKKLTIKKNIR